MPRKKPADSSAPKKTAKPRAPKVQAPAADSAPPAAPPVEASPEPEVEAAGTLADLKPTPPAVSALFGIGARRG